MDALMRRRIMMMELGGSPTPPEPPVIEPIFYDTLIFDGTAYIVTDIIPPTNFSLRFSALGNETLKSAQRVVMCTGTNSAFFGFIYNSNTNSTNRRFSAYYGSSSSLISGTTLSSAFSNATINAFLTPKRIGFGSTTKTFTKGSNTPNGYLHIGQNPSLSGQPFTGSFERLRVYDDSAQNATSASDLFNNYTPVYTLRPCTYNGEAGLWNEEESKFYGNSADAGTLTVRNNT